MTKDPRYPIGRFESVNRPLSEEERRARIDAIEAHPAKMRAAVAGLSDEQLDTRYREDGWTVRQVVHHVVDSHMNSYVRFKLALTEDHPEIRAYDESRWAELPDAKHGPVDGSLAILDTLHARWVTVLRAMTPEQCRRTAYHPEVGDITIDWLLELYGWHSRHHVAHVTELRSREGW